VIKKHNIFVLSTQSADELDILHLCDYVMGIPAAEIVGEASGWQTARRRYCFVYVPDVPGEIGLLPDKTAIDQKFSFG
jgi:hypothetical protein